MMIDKMIDEGGGQFFPSPEASKKISELVDTTETGTPTEPDTDIERAKRMVARLHIGARDSMNGNITDAYSLVSALDEAADVIELLLRRLR